MPHLARARYESILQTIPVRPLYAESWWLDATCGKEHWHIYSFKDAQGNEVACLPYFTTRVASLKAVITPPMTQWLSLIEVSDSAPVDLQDFIDGIKSSFIIDVSLKTGSVISSSQNRVASNLKYSYVITGTSDIHVVRSRYNEGLRRNLKEAEKKYTIVESDDVSALIELSKASYKHRNVRAPAWIPEIARNVFEALKQHNRGRIIFALYDHKPIAGIMTGWDDQTEYYLLGGRKGDSGASAHALLLDHAISHAISRGRKFDFEGSMHPGIANFFQSFGATPEPFLQLRKYRAAGKLWALFH